MNTGFLGPAVATVLTVYGIETNSDFFIIYITITQLQQYLPFTVLKLPIINTGDIYELRLQQYLPFTVLKRSMLHDKALQGTSVATVLTVYGIETHDD